MSCRSQHISINFASSWIQANMADSFVQTRITSCSSDSLCKTGRATRSLPNHLRVIMSPFFLDIPAHKHGTNYQGSTLLPYESLWDVETQWCSTWCKLCLRRRVGHLCQLAAATPVEKTLLARYETQKQHIHPANVESSKLYQLVVHAVFLEWIILYLHTVTSKIRSWLNLSRRGSRS